MSGSGIDFDPGGEDGVVEAFAQLFDATDLELDDPIDVAVSRRGRLDQKDEYLICDDIDEFGNPSETKVDVGNSILDLHGEMADRAKSLGYLRFIDVVYDGRKDVFQFEEDL